MIKGIHDRLAVASIWFLVCVPRWIAIAVLSGVRLVDCLLRPDYEGHLATALDIISRKHSAYRVLRKAMFSRAGRYYSDLLPGVIVHTRHNLLAAQSRDSHNSAPAFATISVTGRCNKRCSGCFAEDAKVFREMPSDSLRGRINELLRLGTRVIGIVGGEPLLYPDLVPLLGSFRNSLFLVYTNGSRVDSSVVDSLETMPNIILMLSLEGPAAITDLRRGRGTFSRIAKAHSELSAHGVLHGLSFTVATENVESVTEDDFLNGFDSSCLGMVQYILSMNSPETSGWGRPLTAAQVLRHNARVRDLRGHRDFAISNLPEDEIRLWGSCPAKMGGVLHIHPDGRVGTCVFGSSSPALSASMSLDKVVRTIRAGRATTDCPSVHTSHIVCESMAMSGNG